MAGGAAEQAEQCFKNLQAIVAVSYTHLDVYKRQALCTGDVASPSATVLVSATESGPTDTVVKL